MKKQARGGWEHFSVFKIFIFSVIALVAFVILLPFVHHYSGKPKQKRPPGAPFNLPNLSEDWGVEHDHAYDDEESYNDEERVRGLLCLFMK